MLYGIQKKTKTDDPSLLTPVPLSSLDTAGWREEDLEAILVERIDYVVREDQLFVVCHERKRQEEADILALDKNGVLYIFELKRWSGKESHLLQVIRYGQIFGRYGYSELESLFRKYVRDETAPLDGRHCQFFQLGDKLPSSQFNSDQRFLVVTAGMDIDTLEAVQYWRGKGLPIQALTYHLYRYGDSFLIEFHAYSPDPDDYAALVTGNYVVNTNVTYEPDAYKEMLDQGKAAAYYGRRNALDSIGKGDTVFLYHTGVGVCAVGRALDKPRGTDYRGDPGQEHFVPLEFRYAADPKLEPRKCVSAAEINAAVSRSYRFRQTAFSITAEMAATIEKLLKDKHDKPE